MDVMLHVPVSHLQLITFIRLPPPLSTHRHRRAVMMGCNVIQLKGKTRQVGAISQGTEPVLAPLGCLQAAPGPEGTVEGSDMVNESLHPSSTAMGTKGSDILFLQSAEGLQWVPDLKTHAWLMLTIHAQDPSPHSSQCGNLLKAFYKMICLCTEDSWRAQGQGLWCDVFQEQFS